VLYEGLEIVDSKYLQRTLETYRLPLAVDVPEVETILLEHGDSAGPFGPGVSRSRPSFPLRRDRHAVEDAIGSRSTAY